MAKSFSKDVLSEMKVIDNRNYVGTDAEAAVLEELRNLAQKLSLSYGIDKKDALYLVKKVLDKVVR
jgi:predicted Ser/Thr protein kinase